LIIHFSIACLFAGGEGEYEGGGGEKGEERLQFLLFIDLLIVNAQKDCKDSVTCNLPGVKKTETNSARLV